MKHGIIYSIPHGLTYDEYVKAAGPAPEGYRWLAENEQVQKGDLQAQWDGTFDSHVYVKNRTGKGFLPSARKIEQTTSPKRVLKIETVGFERMIGGEYYHAVVIAEQSHRGDTFSPSGGDIFAAKNGITLSSSCTPQERLGDGRNTVYVRGSMTNADNNPMILSRDELKRVKEAVAEYNSYVAAPKILKTVAFNYLGGSARGYRVVDVTSEDSTHIKGLDKSLNAPRTYLKSKIEGKILEVRT